MTLHEAIEHVIREEGGAASPGRIATEINRLRLYRKGDGSDVTASQVSARAGKYPDTFDITGDRMIALLNRHIKPYLEFTKQLYRLLEHAPGSSHEASMLVLSMIFSIHFTRGTIYFPEGNYKQSLLTLFQGMERLDNAFKYAFRIATKYVQEILSEGIVERVVKLINAYGFNDLTKPPDVEFGKFFSEIITNSLARNGRHHLFEYTTPNLLSALIAGLYTPQLQDTVVDPFAGTGNLLVEFSKMHQWEQYQYKTVAIDRLEQSVSLGSMNLYANAVRGFHYEHADAFQQQEFLNADLIITDPPLGRKSDERSEVYHWQLFSTTDSFLDAIQFAMHHLSPTGKAVILVPVGFLFTRRDNESRLKRYLVDESLLKGLIYLPPRLAMPLTGTNYALLIIEKNNALSSSDSVFIYDAASVPIDKFQEEIGAITTTFRNNGHIENKCKWISRWDIIDNEYDFSVKRYFLPRFEPPEYVPLGTLLRSIPRTGIHVATTNLNTDEGLPYINGRDLKTGAGLKVLHKEDIRTFISDEELLPPHENKIIPNRAVLLSRIGPHLRPTLFDETFKALCSTNVIFLTTREHILSEYLITQLNEDYVQRQLDAMGGYSTVAGIISLEEIQKLWIRIIPLEEQQRFVISYYGQQITTVEQKELQSREDELYNVISRMKHEIQQPNASIGIDIQLLKEYLSEKEISGAPISLNDYIVPPLLGQQEEHLESTRLKVVLDRIATSVKDTHKTLKKAEESLNIGKSDLKLKVFGIREFIESEIMPLYGNARLSIEIKGKEVDIKADEYQLRLMFKNFIDNAIKHGFNNNRLKSENIIRISVHHHANDSHVGILIANNGSDFSEGFNTALFEKRGATMDRDNGSGFGGYHIKKIIENHGGYLRIKRNNEQKEYTEFKVQFEVYLPIHK